RPAERLAPKAGHEGAQRGDRSPRPAHHSPLSRVRWLTASLFQLGVAIYGGYFGAGIGILMLAVLGFLGLQDIHAMNGLKNFFNLCINAVAASYFIYRGAVVWPTALLIVGGAILGGYGGARFARRIGPTKARAAVVVIGVLIAVLLFWQQARG
ncbi:MAG TPA: sulfite exporter TauE/SafE family protein, partial [Thermoanaerobaculia bacterium]|nr:sulfite exporter TauE/SafE family protein [Thermoanaerobaculia bacterium]